jgi:hypothetical protein
MDAPAAFQELSRVDIVQLMRWLHAADDATVSRVQLELRRRGSTEVQIELARELFDPDPAVRKDLARRLPELQTVNAGSWLLWLCRDDNAEVRLLAVSLLATAGDPSLLTQVERIARNDSDPRIQDQALRIAQQRSGGIGQQGPTTRRN